MIQNEWVQESLRCPCPRRNPLVSGQSGLECAARCGAPAFPVVDGRPVLVDFATSILDRTAVEASAGASPIRRRSGRLRAAVFDLAFGRNRVAESNAKRFLSLLGPAPRVLIIGGGALGAGVEQLYAHPGIRTLTFDVYASPLTDLIADGHSIPLADGSVDAVWIQAVLEHVVEPAQVVAEIHRVLVPDGVVYAETPFMQQVHEAAYDFTRFTESGHRWLFRQFDEVAAGTVLGPGTALLWSIRYAAAGLFRSWQAGTLAALLASPVRLIDRLVPERFAIDGASGCYFLGRRSETTLHPRDMVARYRGALGRSR
ncbi:MAG: class I SAM-dependent methyltransferase [Alphaproteobacteria bacterium]|nr:MAG: class I SAM-dependent methyltransferase [Alphaproteobacteria bacterium]